MAKDEIIIGIISEIIVWMGWSSDGGGDCYDDVDDDDNDNSGNGDSNSSQSLTHPALFSCW